MLVTEDPLGDELVFTVQSGSARRATPISLADAGFRERSDLQEWVRKNPEILGDSVRIVTFEFDAWQGRNRRAADRLDLLGLDEDGRLVVVELKRGPAPDTVEMQAIKYAAMASRFTAPTLGTAHAGYLSAMGGSLVDSTEALRQLEDHIGGVFDPDTLRQPRIVLIAERFPPQVSASSVWLTEMGIQVTLIEFSAWKTANDILLTVSQTWPIPDTEDFVLSPRQIGLRDVQDGARNRRETNAVKQIVDGELLESGARIGLFVGGYPSRLRAQIDEWVSEDPKRAQAGWHIDTRAPLTWAADGANWSPTGLAIEIAVRATGERLSSIAGPRLWRTELGETLAELAGFGTKGATRDWSDLHEFLQVINPGEWVAYGDLAQLIGSSAIAVGSHIASCTECVGGYRVLNAEGRISEHFTWGDAADRRDPESVLRGEGLRFSDGMADPTRRLSSDVLSTRWEGRG